MWAGEFFKDLRALATATAGERLNNKTIIIESKMIIMNLMIIIIVIVIIVF